MESVEFRVLGPVAAVRADAALPLKGPRHRAVLARLIIARRRVVPTARLVRDLWDEPPAGAVGAVQTFVGALRRVLEPERPARTPPRLLVTEGPGYVLRAAPGAVDAWRFEAAVASVPSLPPADALDTLTAALELWCGPAYAEYPDEPWARGERSRLAELRLRAVEQRAEARLALGRAAEAVPDLDAHLLDHPWREDAWRLLALALYRADRQGDALEVLHRARATLAGRLGVDPGPALRRLESAVLRQDPSLDLHRPPPHPSTADAGLGTGTGTDTDAVWARAAAAYDRAVGGGSRARLEAAVGLVRNLAVTGGGGLAAAREHRMAAVAAAEEHGDPELTARVIGGYDVPAVWTRSDDPALAGRIVAAAERTLAALPPEAAARPPGGSGPYDSARCRLLATVALEMRGTRDPRGPDAARRAERLARRLDDPALLAFALNSVWMQSCTRAGLAPRRDAIGAELVALSARHGLVTYEVLGHLVRLQAQAALAAFATADAHAEAADRLAARHELPLVGVFTGWYRALRTAATGTFSAAEAAYAEAAGLLDGAGMPGLERGLPALAVLCLRVAHGRGAQTDPAVDWGPYEPWARPLVLLAQGREDAASAALRAVPEPPRDLLYEAMWCLAGRAAVALGDSAVARRAHSELLPAAAESAGAASGLLTAGPVAAHLTSLASASGSGSGAGSGSGFGS